MLLLVYGTLKKGKFNHIRLGMDKHKFLDNVTIEGASLVQPAGLPYPICIEDKDGFVACELYEILDKNYLRELDAIEKGAGYKRIDVEYEENSFAYIYVDGGNNTYPNLKRFEEF